MSSFLLDFIKEAIVRLSNLFLLAEISARFKRSEYLFCFYLFDSHNLHFSFVKADLNRIRKSKAVITVAN